MVIDPDDELICNWIRQTGLWEPTVRHAILDYLRPDWTFLDLGAYVGYFSLFAGYMGNKVIAMEPNPQSLKYFDKS